MVKFDPGSLFYLGFFGVPSAFGVGPEWPEVFMLFFLFGLWPLVAPLLAGGDRGRSARFLLSQVLFELLPWRLAASLAQLGGQLAPLVRYRGRFPDAESYEQSVRLTLPFEGSWTAVNGGVTRDTSHSWELLAQRYAYDFLRERDGATHEGDGADCADYHCFGERVVAPAPGTVVRATDGIRDFPRPGTGWTEWRTWDIRGNHVVLDHGNGEYSLLAHLQEGSVCVSVGDEVERGERLGACGNSGNSTEPHIHYQLQDHPNFFLAAGLPPTFSDFERERDGDHERVAAGYLTAPATVAPRTRGDGPSAPSTEANRT